MSRLVLAARLLLGLMLLPVAARAEEPVTVFAAASLKGALGEISDAWAQQGHPRLRISFDSSGALARQIQQGAAAHVFISADQKWMDYLVKQNLVAAGSRKNLLTNTLVLVAPADQAKPVVLKPGFDLAGLLGPKGRLSVGDPDTVPAGIYGKQALTRLGVWDQASAHLAPAANVKAALVMVETGEAPAGIVYGTDAKGDSKVAVIGTFPASSHDPITYPIALIAKLGETEPARQALRFLEGPRARAIYVKYGFGVQ
jgi:molybdate transport system substrate-binding protein